MNVMPALHRLLSLGEVVECVFRKRENRFVGVAQCGGSVERVHINNTGRLLDLLYSGARVLCKPIRGGRTSMRVVGTHVGGDMWTLIDTKMQERAFIGAIEGNLIPWLKGYRVARRDVDVMDIRIDLLLRKGDREALAELKSAVFYNPIDMSARYPDTVSLRGRRHVEILTRISNTERYFVFIAAHPMARLFRPSSIDPELPGLLRRAVSAGVFVKAVKLYIYGGSVVIENPDLPVSLEPL